MKKESKIYLLKDRCEYIKKITDDDVINVIGTKGSGKTTSALKYIKDENYIVINCDLLYDMPVDDLEEDKYLKEIKKILKEKYGKIPEGKEFINCYNDILKFAKQKNKKILIEGNALCAVNLITKLNGTVIVMRTGIIKCFIRTIKRDYPNKTIISISPNAVCKSMKFTTLEDILACLEEEKNEITVYNSLIESAYKPIEKMISIS